ncbi:DotU family type VI secretion system protein [soil metagenome]
MTDADSPDTGDRTVIIKPSAGRLARAGATAATTQPGAAVEPLSLDSLTAGGLNPLLAAAAPLLNAAPGLRATLTHPNPAGLKQALADNIRAFEAKARAAGIPNDQVVAARYVICTLLDESAASTPWGSSGAWAGQSLLVEFHNETFGGEKVFLLMSKLAENVNGNRALLELLYVALAFGFEGRYRLVADGRAQLDSVRARLAGMLQADAAAAINQELSPHWRPAAAAAAKLRGGLPVWVAATAVGLLLSLLFVVFRFAVNANSDPVFDDLRSLDVQRAAIVASTPPPPAAKPRLATFLAAEISQGLVEVKDLADRSVITIKGDGFFDPGSAEVSGRVRPLLDRIAAALNDVPGQVLVTGHTDSQPIRSLAHPSNWHLSQARALAVKAVLDQRVTPTRIRAEGRADSEPIDSNEAPAGRARNRRVEVTLFVQPAA